LLDQDGAPANPARELVIWRDLYERERQDREDVDVRARVLEHDLIANAGPIRALRLCRQMRASSQRRPEALQSLDRGFRHIRDLYGDLRAYAGSMRVPVGTRSAACPRSLEKSPDDRIAGHLAALGEKPEISSASWEERDSVAGRGHCAALAADASSQLRARIVSITCIGATSRR
jgi:hypothetical protein